MKKSIAFIVVILCIFLTAGCGAEKGNEVKKTIAGNVKTYCEMTDGTWFCNDIDYKYRLEISGRLPNAACSSTFVYLSNIEYISFEEAWIASGLGSYSKDYFDVEDAVLVEMINS